jgi:hypothetical protein
MIEHQKHATLSRCAQGFFITTYIFRTRQKEYQHFQFLTLQLTTYKGLLNGTKSY